MIEAAPTNWRARLFARVDIASIVFFRVFFGAMMIYHVAHMLSSGWIDILYIRPVVHFTYPGFGWVRPWPGMGMYWQFYLMGLAAIGITLGACYRLSAFVFALGMTHAFLIEKAFYLNHYYLMTLLSWLLVVIPAHHACSVDSWLRPSLRSQNCPIWCLWLLRFQLALPYFYGGIAKLDPDWLQGYPLGMWLKRRGELPWLAGWVDHDWTPIAFSLGGMLLDLFVVPLLLWKRTRLAAYLVAVLFHLMNSSLFEIGIFPWLMMGATLIFFPPDWPRSVGSWIREMASRIGWDSVRSPGDPGPMEFQPAAPGPGRQRLVAWSLGLYVAWQLLFPLRCWFYPGRSIWTEEGHHFAWHMMLREKDVGIRFYVRDPKTGSGGVVDCRSFLTERQMSRMGKDSDMILTFIHFLRDHFLRHGQGNLQIRVLALVSLNGRKPQLMLDPTIDYARTARRWSSQPWIIPLCEPLRSEPWDVPLVEWETHVEAPSPEEMVQESPRHERPMTVGTF